MSEQIFISYRRDGGDVTAKLICEALKNHGYTVFYDFDSLRGGYFDDRIYKAIEECNDFVLVLPAKALDRCVNEGDWVRQEIRHALEHGKNIIPVMLPGFEFPPTLPDDIASISRYNGVLFVMAYFDAVISALIGRFTAKTKPVYQQTPSYESDPSSKGVEIPPIIQDITHLQDPNDEHEPIIGSEGLEYTLNPDETGYKVSIGTCVDTEIVIPQTFNGKPITEIAEKAFYKCSSLTSICIPEGVDTIRNYAFKSCSSLTSVILPNSLKHIGSDAFGQCSSLASICIPENVDFIGGWAFCMCSSLASINIPDGVTRIFDSTFSFCDSLTSANIPHSVTKIKSKAFAYCSALERINYNGTANQWHKVILEQDCFPKHITAIRCTDGDCPL